LLALPLFILIYKFGGEFIERMGWTGFRNPRTRAGNLALCVHGVILAWLVLMHGNYAALRDAASVLPYTVAGILFASTAFVVQKLRTIDAPTPEWYRNMKYKRPVSVAVALVVVALAGFSGMPTWWGFLMASAAVVCGALVGRGLARGVGPVPMTTIIIFALTTLVLMQPEFFRFGQLGGLTALHMLAVSFAGILSAAVLTVRNVGPRGAIRASAYAKLKWMARIVAGLCMVLFFLTESVPVFVGFVCACAALFAISARHAEKVPESLSEKLWAALLCVFGVMTALPLITALGVAYWTSLPRGGIWKQAKFLL
jgi:hypothetical protein